MKFAFITIFILTVADAICTAVGVINGWLIEGNVLLARAVTDSPILACSATALAVGLLLLWIWNIKDKIKWLKYPIIIILCEKIIIMVMHVFIISRAITL